MNKEPIVIGDMVAKIPLIQGGMGVGISLGGLAGAVARTGGIGIISSAQIGFREPDFDTNVREANIRAIKKEMKRARKIAPNGIVGFNIMVALKHYAEHVKAAVEAGADMIVSGAGLPTELPKLVGKARTKLAPIVSSVRSAAVILKYWDKKYNRIPDLLVIEGPEAGGHLGFSREELADIKGMNYQEEVIGIIDLKKQYEEKYDTPIPVAVGGGIYTSEDARECFLLGANAVQVATRFITTKECDADEAYKMAYVRAEKEDVTIIKSPVGMPGRALRNKLISRINAGERIPHSPCHSCVVTCNPSETPYCITDTLITAARGNVDEGLLFSGAKVWKQNKIETVEEVIHSIMGTCKK